MNWSERRKYWRAFHRVQAQIEAKYFPRVQKILLKQISSFIDSAKGVGYQRAYHSWQMELFNQELNAAILSLYKKAAITFANMSRRAIKMRDKYSPMGFDEQWTRDVLEYLGTDGLNLVSWMDDSTKQIILDIITQGVQEGLGFDEVTSLIMKSPIADRWRVLRIVRTESMRAANFGAMLGAKSHKVVMEKVWISAHDERVRQFSHKDQFDHLRLDGTHLGMTEPFTQVGSKGLMAQAQQPGDPKAPAAFTINCRCVVGFEPKRDVNGRLQLIGI